MAKHRGRQESAGTQPQPLPEQVVSSEEIRGLSSGFAYIDHVTDVPHILFPEGCVTELFGPKSSSKTTLVMSAIAYNQMMDPNFCVLYCDYEGTIVKAVPYYTKLGVSFAPNVFKYRKPPDMETGCAELLSAIKTMSVKMIVIDTIAAMVPKEEKKNVNEGFDVMHSPIRAKLMSLLLRNLTSELPPNGPAVVFINHQYERIEFNGRASVKIYDTPSSNTLKFYAANRYEVRQCDRFLRKQVNPMTLEETETPVAGQINIKAEKNKIGRPLIESKYWVTYGEGVDPILTIKDTAVKLGKLQFSGGKYKIDGSEKWIVGYENFREHLLTNHDDFIALGEKMSPLWKWQIQTFLALRNRSEVIEPPPETLEEVKIPMLSSQAATTDEQSGLKLA